MSGDNQRPILIKKVKKVSGGGHHGGAWKVAYADFVTAMMAFFLLMWLINTTSPEQKRGIADYFAPASVSKSAQGSDGLLGGTAFEDEGARSSGAMRPMPEVKSKSRKRARRDRGSGGSSSGLKDGSPVSESALQQALANRERAEFARAEQSLRQAMLDLPDLAELSRHLILDQTPEGLRIQLVDQEGRAMFEKGSDEPLARTETLLKAVAKIIEKLPNRVSISGHTGTSPPGKKAGYSNWELSSGRANAARRILEQHGMAQDRIYQVSGKASSEPLYPDDPNLPGNRRISIVLLREAPVLPAGHSLGR